MNLRQLQVFAAVAEAGNVTAGSELLHISQPAVSKHIRDLEQELDTLLLDRHPRGVTLTEAGEVVLRHARGMKALQEDVHEELASLRGLRSGHLAIGASTTIGSYLVPETLERFHRAHPRIRLSLEVANTQEIQTRLSNYALDLGLTEGFVESEDLVAEVFARDRLVPVAAPAFVRRHRADGLETLAKLPCVLRESGSGTRAVVERAFERHSTRVQPLMSLGNTEAIKRIVAAGLGYTVISELAVRDELDAGRLHKLEIPELSIPRPLHLIRLKGRSTSPALAAFIGLLRAGTTPGGGQ